MKIFLGFVSLLFLGIVPTAFCTEGPFTRLNLRALLFLPSPLREAREFRVDSLNIPEFGLALEGAKILYREDESFKVSIRKVEIRTLEVLKFLKKEAILKDVPLKIEGVLSLKGIELVWRSQALKLHVKEVALDGIEIFESLRMENVSLLKEASRLQFSATRIDLSNSTLSAFEGELISDAKAQKDNLALTFSGFKLELSTVYEVLDKFFPHKILSSFEKEFPWLKLEYPELSGVLVINQSKVSLVSGDKNWSLLSFSGEIGESKVSVFAAGREILSCYLKGELSYDENHYSFRFPSVTLSLKDVRFSFPKLKVEIEDSLFGIKELEGIYGNNTDLKLNFLIEILGNGKVKIEGEDWKKILSFLAPSSARVSLKSLKEKAIGIDDLFLAFRDENGGKVKIEGSLGWPFSWPEAVINLEVESFRFKDLNFVKFLASKKEKENLRLEARIQDRDLDINLDEAFLEYTPERLSLRGRTLKLVSLSSEERETSVKPEPTASSNLASTKFDFGFLEHLRKIAPEWELSLDTMEYGDFMPLERILLKLSLSQEPADFLLRAESCYTSVALSGEIEKGGKLLLSGETQTLSAPVDNFLACFLREAPVYILGNLTFKVSMETEGDNVKELLDKLSFEGVGEIRGGKILKISHLNSNLRWFLNVLSLVKLNPTKLKDTIVFEALGFAVEGGISDLYIKRFFLSSPLLKFHLDMRGNVQLRPEIKKDLWGEVSVMGVSKEFKIKDDGQN
ncbi:hypothetical protein [Thermosulfurimonas dismutans]|uniref:Uncharacterized protein n=1 Tax=Thermosulfurimonas dismutans TaxID=999894 RepID=A0A179D4C1_9BACT|nr:hypothetical protein [Thermosulfurimonas dismutans]OAQ20934.1 hypothetical protein TDIS_0860 [Thermosulfurimonas dismutans]